MAYSREKRSILECDGKRSATPLWLAPDTGAALAKAPSPPKRPGCTVSDSVLEKTRISGA
jgi:hypothetical protein